MAGDADTRCEHGNDWYEECEECGRYSDGADGSSAGEYRAIVKLWRTELARQEREWSAGDGE